MSPAEIVRAYQTIQPKTRETDLTKKCVEKVIRDVVGDTVLDLGCGGGFLADKLTHNSTVTAADFNVDHHFAESKPYKMLSLNLEETLPFADNEFDTVTCVHTLEHLASVHNTLDEIRRVARSRAIIIVPLQRPYMYTVDLHVQFFPYPWSFLNVARPTFCPKIVRYKHTVIDGDLYYVENYI